MLYNIALAFRWPNHPAKRITMGVHNMFSLFLLGLTPARSINYRPKTSEICRIFCTVLLFWSLIIIHEWGVIEKKLEKIRLFDFSTRQKNVVYETSLITIHTGRLYSHMIFFLSKGCGAQCVRYSSVHIWQARYICNFEILTRIVLRSNCKSASLFLFIHIWFEGGNLISTEKKT